MKALRTPAVGRTAVFLIICIALIGFTANAKTKLALYIWDGAHRTQEISNYLNKTSSFAEEHPDIEVEILTCSPGVQRVEQLLVWIAAGTVPDIVDSNREVVLSMAGHDVFEDLTTFFERDPKITPDDFIPCGIDFLTVNDKLLGLPTGLHAISMYQNATLFAEAGLKPFTPDEEWNWDEFSSVLGRLRRIEHDKVVQWGSGINRIPIRSAHWFWQAGARFWTSDFSESRINLPEAVETFEFIADLLAQGLLAPEPGWGVNTLFVEGRLGMLAEGTWAIRGNLDDRPYDVAFTLLPSYRQKATFATANGYAITTASDHKLAAWELIKFLAGQETFTQIETWRQPAIPALLGLQPLWLDMVSDIPNGTGFEAFIYALDYGRPNPAPPGVSAGVFFETWERITLGLWQGTVGPQAVAEQLKTQMDALLK